MTWSVRLLAPNEPETNTGGTGFTSEAFARDVYEKLVERVSEAGGSVALLRDGEVVVSFSKGEP